MLNWLKKKKNKYYVRMYILEISYKKKNILKNKIHLYKRLKKL
jgi:hypothetical protein